MTTSSIIGWDIGGAHTKAAVLDRNGRLTQVHQRACPLWKGISYLEEALYALARDCDADTAHAITMTGELADIFPNRADGVTGIVNCFHKTLPAARRVGIYSGSGQFLRELNLKTDYLKVASANWKASEEWVAKQVEAALFVDVGSTTTDIAILTNSQAATRAETDGDRMACGELLYLGAVRTPLMALCERAPFDGEWTTLASEQFAVTADVFRLTGQLPGHADMHQTADGQDKSVEASARRLARMLGRDAAEASHEQWLELAAYFRDRLTETVHQACARQLSRNLIAGDAPLIGAGVGRFIVQAVAARLNRPYIDFQDLLEVPDHEIPPADCAPAVAVAFLYREFLQIAGDNKA